jgi:hypothetical protein
MINNKKGMSKGILVFFGIVIVVMVLFLIFRGGGSSTGAIIEDANTIKISLKDISTKATFYEYNGAKYFAVKANDGSIKTAFDACDVCGGTKGYSQEGNDMVCNNCGRHFNINSLGEDNIFGGGCWPGYLENSVKDRYVVINKADIEDNNYIF